MNMEITKQHFENLRVKFGNHTKAAKALGIGANHYRYVRKTGKMSEPLARLIILLNDRGDKAA